MSHCIECGKPWGVLLERGEQPSPEKLVGARAELIEMLREQWDCDYELAIIDNVDWSQLPPVRATEVVYVTEALARFADDHGLGELSYEDCWIEEDWADVPAWLLKGRKHRWALRWDCCNIGFPEIYATKSAVGVSVPLPEKDA